MWQSRKFLRHRNIKPQENVVESHKEGQIQKEMWHRRNKLKSRKGGETGQSLRECLEDELESFNDFELFRRR